MQLLIVYVTVCTLINWEISAVGAYPTLAIPQWYGRGNVFDTRYKKNEPIKSQPDTDVLALEHLKEQEHEEHGDQTTAVVTDEGIESLPDLERQLEAEITSTTETATEIGRHDSGHGAHRPPILPHNDGGRTINHHAEPDGSVAAVPSMIKPFYGAARLAFGQNPEVLPTVSTTSTTTTTTTIAPSRSSNDEKIAENVDVILNNEPAQEAIPGETLISTIPHSSVAEQVSEFAPATAINVRVAALPEEDAKKDSPDGREIITEIENLQIPKKAARRSVSLMPPKTMAQYVFWTGDEAGVARAIEEFIEQGLMTREGALKFLKDIRLGIDYLQQVYKDRMNMEDGPHQDNLKKSYDNKLFPFAPPTPSTTTTSTTATTTTTSSDPVIPSTVNANILRLVLHRQLGSRLPSTFDDVPSSSTWSKLSNLEQANNNVGQSDISNYDDAVGRAKVAEFLYSEYTLEEILYKLAKVMFTQSLAQGSDEAQHELFKLTNFLEREGNLGVIPIDLQRSVLNVLLTALSDTLTEHPELLPAARSNLFNQYNGYGKNTYGPPSLKV